MWREMKHTLYKEQMNKLTLFERFNNNRSTLNEEDIKQFLKRNHGKENSTQDWTFPHLVAPRFSKFNAKEHGEKMMLPELLLYPSDEVNLHLSRENSLKYLHGDDCDLFEESFFKGFPIQQENKLDETTTTMLPLTSPNMKIILSNGEIHEEKEKSVLIPNVFSFLESKKTHETKLEFDPRTEKPQVSASPSSGNSEILPMKLSSDFSEMNPIELDNNAQSRNKKAKFERTIQYEDNWYSNGKSEFNENNTRIISGQLMLNRTNDEIIQILGGVDFLHKHLVRGKPNVIVLEPGEMKLSEENLFITYQSLKLSKIIRKGQDFQQMKVLQGIIIPYNLRLQAIHEGLRYVVETRKGNDNVVEIAVYFIEEYHRGSVREHPSKIKEFISFTQFREVEQMVRTKLRPKKATTPKSLLAVFSTHLQFKLLNWFRRHPDGFQTEKARELFNEMNSKNVAIDSCPCPHCLTEVI